MASVVVLLRMDSVVLLLNVCTLMSVTSSNRMLMVCLLKADFGAVMSMSVKMTLRGFENPLMTAIPLTIAPTDSVIAKNQ